MKCCLPDYWIHGLPVTLRMFGVKIGKFDCLRIKNWSFPEVAILGAYQKQQKERIRSSRVSGMKLSFLIIQGIFLCSVRSYNNNSPRISKDLQAAAKFLPIYGNVKTTCDVKRTNSVVQPRTQVLSSLPQRREKREQQQQQQQQKYSRQNVLKWEESPQHHYRRKFLLPIDLLIYTKKIKCVYRN